MNREKALPSPIKIKRELIPGVYGRVKIREDFTISVSLADPVTVDDLWETAHTLNQIAEYMCSQ